MVRLTKKNVEILTGAKIDRVKGKKIIIRCNGVKREIPFTRPIVNATGVEANNELAHSLRGMEELKGIDLYEIGDCVSARQLREAIFEGYMISKNILGDKGNE